MLTCKHMMFRKFSFFSLTFFIISILIYSIMVYAAEPAPVRGKTSQVQIQIQQRTIINRLERVEEKLVSRFKRN
jgi:hypothetical protein